MKRIATFIALSGLLYIASCSDNRMVFERNHRFEQKTWDRFNQILFNFPIEDTSATYNISLVVKPEAQFEYTTLPVYVILATPSGEERMNEVKVKMKEGDKFIGAEEGKPVVISTVLWKDLKISEKGNCKLSIENMIPKIQTLGLSEIGLIVEKASK